MNNNFKRPSDGAGIPDSLPSLKRSVLSEDPLWSSNLNEAINSNLRTVHEKKWQDEAKEMEYRKAVINALQGIEKNTALLTEMTILLQKNNDNQEQVFELITEILTIMKSKNKDEVESKFLDVMKKIGVVSGGISGASSLYSMAQSVYTASLSMF